MFTPTKMAVLLVVTAIASVPCAQANAQAYDADTRTLRWYSQYGYTVDNQPEGEEEADGMRVSLSISDSGAPTGMMYVRARICNENGYRWVGGVRVTDREPSDAHTTLRIAPGSCANWSEYLEDDSSSLYVYMDPDDR